MNFEFLVFLPFIIVILVFVLVIVGIVKNTKANKKRYDALSSNAKVRYGEQIEKYYHMLISDPELTKMRNKDKVNSKIIILGILAIPVSAIFKLPFIGFILMFVTIFIYSINAKKYSDYYKKHVVTLALKDYDSNLQYSPNEGISNTEYKHARFESYDRFHSEDKINGTLDNLPFIISDVHTEDEHTDSDGNTTYVTIFHGPVAILTLANPTDTEVSILCNGLKAFSGDSYIEIDNPEFEKDFDVYTTDKIAAMRILTPAVTTKLLELKNKYYTLFEVKLINQLVYFRFHSGELFVPCSGDTRKEATDIAMYFEMINGIKDVMKEINNSIDFLKK